MKVGDNHTEGSESVHCCPKRVTGKQPPGYPRCSPVKHSLIALRNQ